MSLDKLRNRKKSAETIKVEEPQVTPEFVEEPQAVPEVASEPKVMQQPVYQPVGNQPMYNQQPMYQPMSVQRAKVVNGASSYMPQQQPQYMTSSTALVSVEEKEQYLKERLGIDPNEDIVVYDEPAIEVEALNFEIKDPNGKIAQKVLIAERETGLHVIPFKIAGLNKMVTEIMGYDIIEIDGEKFATSKEHSIQDMTVSNYERKWCEILQSGEPVNESLMIEVNVPGYGTVKTIALNQFEIKYLMGRFRLYNVLPFAKGNDVFFTIGE